MILKQGSRWQSSLSVVAVLLLQQGISITQGEFPVATSHTKSSISQGKRGTREPSLEREGECNRTLHISAPFQQEPVDLTLCSSASMGVHTLC